MQATGNPRLLVAALIGMSLVGASTAECAGNPSTLSLASSYSLFAPMFTLPECGVVETFAGNAGNTDTNWSNLPPQGAPFLGTCIPLWLHHFHENNFGPARATGSGESRGKAPRPCNSSPPSSRPGVSVSAEPRLSQYPPTHAVRT